jgi:hypothetical protein
MNRVDSVAGVVYVGGKCQSCSALIGRSCCLWLFINTT